MSPSAAWVLLICATVSVQTYSDWTSSCSDDVKAYQSSPLSVAVSGLYTVLVTLGWISAAWLAKQSGTWSSDPKEHSERLARAVTFTLAISIDTRYCSAHWRMISADLSKGKSEGSDALTDTPPATRAGVKTSTRAHTQVLQTLLLSPGGATGKGELNKFEESRFSAKCWPALADLHMGVAC